MSCAFEKNGTCTLGLLNLFGCPNNCSRFVEDNEVDEDFVVSDEDRTIINICRKIHKFVNMNRVDIDMKQHSVSDSKHLVKFLELCGKSFREVVLQYLANIQPFQLIRDKTQEFDKSISCIIDLSYGFALYVKIKFTSTNSLVISFHENQMKKNKVFRVLNSNLNYAIVKTDVPIGSNRILPVKISHDLVVFELNLVCRVVEQDLVQISIDEVNSAYLKYANDKLASLSSKIGNTFSTVKSVTFTSYGEAILNNISILVDAICLSGIDQLGRLELTEVLRLQMLEVMALPNYQEYLDALDERYSEKLGSAVEKPRLLLGI